MKLRNALLLAMIVVCVGGCQSYDRRPLELTEYEHEWAGRSLDVEPILSYAASLVDVAEAQAPFDAGDGLSLGEAEAVALHFNPRLRVARAEAKVPLASAKEAGWWPDPQFRAQVLRFVDRGDKTRFKLDTPSFDGVNAGGLETTPTGFRRVEDDFIDDPWILNASLSITIPISGRLGVEKDLGWAQYSAAWRRILVAEWELLTRLRGAWLEWSTAHERLSVTREYVENLESIADIATQLMGAGEMKPTEERLLRIELARRRTNMLAFEREVERHRLTLFAMMGLSPAAPVALNPDVFIASIDVPPDRQTAEVLSHHPLIKSVEADYETAEQQLRLEIRLQYPDLDIGPSYSIEEGLSRFGLGFGFPLPIWNRNRQAIAEAVAAREAAQVAAETTIERVLSQLAQARSRMTFAGRQRAMLLEEVAPLVDKQVSDSRVLLGLGEVDVLLLRDALTGSLETKLELMDVTLAEAKAANDLQQMVRPRWFTPSEAESKEKE
ncbi:MAG: TolC family protein [Planctomycetes bacterium]|nr:TolC family protein [Planctomycetota bacterium]